MTCAQCGNALTPNDRFCGSCGTPVPVTAPVAAPAAPPARTPDLPQPVDPTVVAVPVTGATPTAGTGAIPSAGATPGAAPPAGVSGKPSRKLVIAAAAAVGLLVIVAGGVAIGVTIGASVRDGSSASAPVEPDPVDVYDTVDDEPQAAAPAEPTATSAPVVNEAPIEFRSQSGNIRCRMAPDGVVCHQGEHTYAKPSYACKSGPKGVTVGLNQQGILWPCLSSDITTSYILPYDTIVSAHGYDCIITYLTGVTCTNTMLAGFQMEYDLGIKAVQY